MLLSCMSYSTIAKQPDSDPVTREIFLMVLPKDRVNNEEKEMTETASLKNTEGQIIYSTK